MKTIVLALSLAMLGTTVFAQTSDLGRIADALESQHMRPSAPPFRDINREINYDLKAREREWAQQAQAQYGANMEMQARYYMQAASAMFKQVQTLTTKVSVAERKLKTAELKIKKLEDQLKKAGIAPVK